MHFGHGQDEPRIRSGQYELQIPLRHPLEVAASWARRGKNPIAMVQAYECMFRHLDAGVPHVIHKMEDLPRLAGIEDSDRNTVTGQWAISKQQDELLLKVVHPHLEFFEQYYG